MENYKIKINDTELSVGRLNLKGWTSLDSLRKRMEDAISKSDYTDYFDTTVRFIEIASFPIIDWSTVPWFTVLEIYSKVVEINKPTIEFSILRGRDDKEDKKLPWEYDGRAWFFWFNLFASNYGWTENQIEHLDIDTALGLYQEILLSDQLDKEWTWGLSEMAYVYEKSTKKSVFRPLSRPNWMKPLIPKQLPTIKIRKDMMPVGNIISMDDMGKKIANSNTKPS